MNKFQNWRTMNGINVGSPIHRGHPHATHKYVNILCQQFRQQFSVELSILG